MLLRHLLGPMFQLKRTGNIYYVVGKILRMILHVLMHLMGTAGGEVRTAQRMAPSRVVVLVESEGRSIPQCASMPRRVKLCANPRAPYQLPFVLNRLTSNFLNIYCFWIFVKLIKVEDNFHSLIFEISAFSVRGFYSHPFPPPLPVCSTRCLIAAMLQLILNSRRCSKGNST